MLSYVSSRRRGGDFRLPGRHFNPACESIYRRIPKDQLLVYSATKAVLQIKREDPHDIEAKAHVDADSLVVSIASSCRNPGIRGVRAAYGIYFGPKSPYNTSALLNAALPQTETRAEIEALQQALHIIATRIISYDFRPRRCYIKTHSAYIQRVFPCLVRRWAADCGTNVFGEKVVFFELLVDIEKRMAAMARGDGDGERDVLIWCAERGENLEAEGLAAEAITLRVNHGCI
ncbi:hypothetical protein ACQKWADRAFT_302723 [Trichoderma austrokoningii]